MALIRVRSDRTLLQDSHSTTSSPYLYVWGITSWQLVEKIALIVPCLSILQVARAFSSASNSAFWLGNRLTSDALPKRSLQTLCRGGAPWRIDGELMMRFKMGWDVLARGLFQVWSLMPRQGVSRPRFRRLFSVLVWGAVCFFEVSKSRLIGICSFISLDLCTHFSVWKTKLSWCWCLPTNYTSRHVTGTHLTSSES